MVKLGFGESRSRVTEFHRTSSVKVNETANHAYFFKSLFNQFQKNIIKLYIIKKYIYKSLNFFINILRGQLQLSYEHVRLTAVYY